MDIKKYEWFKSVVEALKTAKVSVATIEISDHAYFDIKLRMKE